MLSILQIDPLNNHSIRFPKNLNNLANLPPIITRPDLHLIPTDNLPCFEGYLEFFIWFYAGCVIGYGCC